MPSFESRFTEGWPVKNSMETDLVGSIILNNGSTVCVVSKVIDCPDFSESGGGTGHYFKEKSKDDLKDTEYIRALAFGDNPDGSRVIYDFSVKPKTS